MYSELACAQQTAARLCSILRISSYTHRIGKIVNAYRKVDNCRWNAIFSSRYAKRISHDIRFVPLDKRAITQGRAVFPFSLCSLSLDAAIARS